MKHLKVCQKDSAERRIFNSLLSVSSGDETLHLMFDILLQIFPCFKLIVLITIPQNEKKKNCAPVLAISFFATKQAIGQAKAPSVHISCKSNNLLLSTYFFLSKARFKR